ncbi:Uncharacterised protein [Candidatus Burarchaeum australiense]|nr:Uncharacterised protein [Candidatus Burarchaeum australiense]
MKIPKLASGSRRAFFFTGAVIILLVLLLTSTQLWVAVSNARSERAPILTEGQQVQTLKASIYGYPRALQAASEQAFYQSLVHIYERAVNLDTPSPDPCYASYRYSCQDLYNQCMPGGAHNPLGGAPDACCVAPGSPGYCADMNPLCDERAAILGGYFDPLYPFTNVPYDSCVNDHVLHNYFCNRLAMQMDQWATSTVSLANQMGLTARLTLDYRSTSPACQLELSDYRTVHVIFTGRYEIHDKETGAMLASGELPGNAYVDVNGMPDPAIWALTRDAGHFAGITRAMYFDDNVKTPSQASPTLVAQGARGKGWFYGKTTTLNNPSELCQLPAVGGNANGNPKKCIVVVDSSALPAAIPSLQNYGGVIVRKVRTPPIFGIPVTCDGLPAGIGFRDPTDTLDSLFYLGFGIDNPSPTCYTPALGVFANAINVPFVEVDPADFPDSKIGNYYLIESGENSNPQQYWRNTVAGNGNFHDIWDMENLRAMAVCGYYVNNPDAPDFLQRMLVWPADEPIPQSINGVESFVVGKGVTCAWGQNLPSGPLCSPTGDINPPGMIPPAENGIFLFSNVDHMFYAQVLEQAASGDSSHTASEATRIRGMPGCRELDQCSSLTHAGQYSPLGHFALDASHIVNANPLNSYLPTGADSFQCTFFASCDEVKTP